MVQEADSVVMETEDGVHLQGAWQRCEDPAAVAVVVHGFAASVEDPGIRQLSAQLSASSFDVLSYDARGHGESGGQSGVGSAEHHDVAAATAVAAGQGLPVVLVGVSMGVVGIVRHLSDGSDPAVAGAVLVSGPARWRMSANPVGVLTALLTKTAVGRNLAARHLRVRIAPGWRTGEAPEEMLRRVSVPVAVVHGAKDRLLSPDHGNRLHRSAGGLSRLDIVADMGHGVRDSGWPWVVESAQWVTGTLEVGEPAAVPARPKGVEAPGSLSA